MLKINITAIKFCLLHMSQSKTYVESEYLQYISCSPDLLSCKKIISRLSDKKTRLFERLRIKTHLFKKLVIEMAVVS